MIVTTLLLAAVVSAGAERADTPILLDFHASWCGPCQEMRPAVRRLIEHKYPIKSIDVDRSPELAKKYQITSIPAFVVVDGSGKVLAKTVGPRPAGQLARFYLAARNKAADEYAEIAAAPPEAAEEVVPAEIQAADNSVPTPEDDGSSEPADLDVAVEPAAPINPKPWQTVVRIKVQGPGNMTGFGSGTVIYSDPEQAIILTCAHIFKLDGPRQAHPSKFPSPIQVDLFDGKLSGQQPAQVHYARETYKGQAMDYDFVKDVGLLRIRPGKRIPAARVVPAFWKPKKDMGMIAVGCPEGQDATAWDTVIVKASMMNVPGHQQYEAIECTTAPKQGRSGGGLFTHDGFVAGVCDFASPQDDHGLYATPRSIYAMLDRNNLMALYAPPGKNNGEMLAQAKPRAVKDQNRLIAHARAQSPEAGDITVPPPDLLGIRDPGAIGWKTDSPRGDRRVARLQPTTSDESNEGNRSVQVGLVREQTPADTAPTSDPSDADLELNAEDIPEPDSRPADSRVSGWKAGQFRNPQRALVEAP
ncbi:thioredoxin domain-containing protein [Isosphaeraceae bacterium EP7]